MFAGDFLTKSSRYASAVRYSLSVFILVIAAVIQNHVSRPSHEVTTTFEFEFRSQSGSLFEFYKLLKARQSLASCNKQSLHLYSFYTNNSCYRCCCCRRLGCCSRDNSLDNEYVNERRLFCCELIDCRPTKQDR